MDEIDEKGVAAHWKYKNQNHVYDENDDKIDGWLHTIKEILDDPQPDTLDLLDTIKLNLFAREIIVFTPKGDIKSLPAGATALDFAFSIRTMLGTHCIGAKVNHVLKPLMYKLEGGDQVEIITSNTQQVKHGWLEYVTTAKAKSKIQACLRKMNRELQHEGNKKLQVFLENKELEFNSTNLEKLRRFHHFHSREEMLMAIGSNTLELNNNDVNFLKGKNKSKWKKFLPFTSYKEEVFETEPNIDFINNLDHKKVLVINDHNIHQCTIADCCRPIPGDDILGYIDDNSHSLIIHKRNCETATKLKSKFGNNIIATRWDVHKTPFKARIAITGIDCNGILLKIADTLYSHEHINVTALNIEGKDGVFEASLSVLVHNVHEVTSICQSLQQIENIVKAYRVD
jgi:GTP pyrophosphokinase